MVAVVIVTMRSHARAATLPVIIVLLYVGVMAKKGWRAGDIGEIFGRDGLVVAPRGGALLRVCVTACLLGWPSECVRAYLLM